MSYDRLWRQLEGAEATQARALWALGTGSVRSRNPGHRKLATQLFERSLGQVETLESPQAWALALLGIHEFLRGSPDRPQAIEGRALLVGKLVAQFQQGATDARPWFEACLTGDHARLPQALLRSSVAMGDPQAREIGLKALGWLASVQTTSKGHFRPMGHGFQGQEGAGSEQWPVEAQAMVSACLTAFRLTRDPIWSKEAKRAFEWFLGRNDVGLSIYDSGSGGCADGLCKGRVSDHQGAEATLAFHLALAEMSFAEHQLPAGV